MNSSYDNRPKEDVLLENAILKYEIKKLLNECAKIRKAAEAFRDLSTCYRTGKRPSESLFARLQKAQEILKEEK